MTRLDDGDSDIGVGQQLEVGIVEDAGDFADHAGSVLDDVGREVFDRAFPRAAGKGIPCDFDCLALLQTTDFRLVDKRAHADTVQVGNLNEKIAGGART